MSISYSRVNWQNDPSTQTPLSAANLNTMDKGIDDVVTKVNTLVPVEANPVGVASEDLTALGVNGTIYSVGVGIPSGGSANQILTKKSSTDYDVEWSNAPSVGGILPKLTVNTITGATVTATLGGTTVSLSETGVGTGVYEGDLTDLGTWTITVTNGETITQTLLVDTVKLYNITISSFSATIQITYPSGASCTCAGGGETQTATSNPETFTVSSADTYVITVVDNDRGSAAGFGCCLPDYGRCRPGVPNHSGIFGLRLSWRGCNLRIGSALETFVGTCCCCGRHWHILLQHPVQVPYARNAVPASYGLCVYGSGCSVRRNFASL